MRLAYTRAQRFITSKGAGEISGCSCTPDKKTMKQAKNACQQYWTWDTMAEDRLGGKALLSCKPPQYSKGFFISAFLWEGSSGLKWQSTALSSIFSPFMIFWIPPPQDGVCVRCCIAAVHTKHMYCMQLIARVCSMPSITVILNIFINLQHKAMFNSFIVCRELWAWYVLWGTVCYYA